MSRRSPARAQNAADMKAAHSGALATAATETPLGYALRVMCDDNAPTTLRASMAKAALPYLHWRLPTAEPPPPPAPPMPELTHTELVRRIAFLLNRDPGGDDGGDAGSAIMPTPQVPAAQTPPTPAPVAVQETRAPPAPPAVNYVVDAFRRDQMLPPARDAQERAPSQMRAARTRRGAV
jgi:hypothetical protein